MNVNLLAILPEVLILVLAMLVLVLDPFWKDEKRRLNLGWLTAGGLFAILGISLLVGRPGPDGVLAWGGMVRFDMLAYAFKLFFIFAAAISALFMMDVEGVSRRAEAFVLLLAATIGMSLMASASDLVMLYLAIETTSIPLYVLAGFLLDDKKSIESGFKYLLFGAMTSATLLYGLTLVYGFGGTTSLDELARQFSAPTPFSIGVLLLLLVGLGFKLSLVPFHFWAPDTYEGAPTPVAGFLSTASKAAGFAVLLRLFLTAFGATADQWQMVLAILAAVTMIFGNLVALAQKNIKRLLAYSSIAHAGYALLGVIAASSLGVASAIFYLLAYILTNLAAFGIIAIVGRSVGSDEIRAYDGLSRRSPYLALAMLVAFLSLSGMPPFGGFVGKFLVFFAAIEAGWTWLVVIGIIVSIVGVYYYLTVMKYVYLYRMEGEDEASHPIAISRPHVIAIALLTAGIILVGTFFAPWFGLSSDAAASLFSATLLK
ncbi:MAG: NADH-quinone oxidoreductase subunit N [Anaerolineales bacterium]|jgi:NADH-quinone oxidoreductase subunit N|nr:NADH-quinone oxidoreductase subunit N [Anaerolineales bacterium]